jgi:hypothetical protein
MLLFVILLFGCGSSHNPLPDAVPWVNDQGQDEYGQGGSGIPLTVPFLSGEYWYVTQTYDQGSHVDYGFDYGNDTYAVDFSQSGCEAYGKSVTPMSDGTVLQVFVDGDGDHGYGNSVLIDHGGGFVSRYAHFSETKVEVGEQVNTNTVIGRVGNSGYAVGSACSSYPGTHLHIALYENGVPSKPEPLSGLSPINEGCWISREGDQSCNGNPGDYDSIDDEGEMDIRMLEHSPSWGTAQETDFVWVARIESPDLKPEATLFIYNANDGVTYDFPMETESQGNPWIFIYQKDLRDSGNYSYWVSADNGDGNDQTSTHSMEVNSRSYDEPDLLDAWAVQMSGEEYEWRVIFESYLNPDDATLFIVNPNHSTVYDFEMALWHEGDLWAAGYEKSLDDKTVYPFWMTVDNGESISTTKVEWLDLND